MALSACVVGVYVYSVRDRIVASYHQKGSDAAYSIELFLNGRLQALRIMAEQPEIASLDASTVRPRLVKLTENWGLRNAALFDADGRFVTSVDASHPPLVNDYPTFFQALSGNLVVSNRITRRVSDTPFISLRVPVRNEQGVAVGVLAAGICGLDVAEIIGGIIGDATIKLLLLDGKNELIYYSDLSKMLLNGPALKSLAAECLRPCQGGTYATLPFEKISELFISVPVKGTDWLLVTAVPTTSLLAEVAREASFGVAAIVLTILCIGLRISSWDEGRRHRRELEDQRTEQLASIHQLAAGIAHEIRNPLTSIKGFIQLALTKPDRTVNAGHMELVLDEIGRIEQLINEFRLLARPSEQVDMGTIDLTSTVSHVVTLLNSEALAKCVVLEYSPGAEILTATGNVSALKQLWINLLRNAIEAVPSGGKVGVAISRKQKSAVIAIKDNGMGIPEDNLARLGTPFFTTKDNGTGLGLSVSYNIVHKHGGTIEYSSTVGKGTTVRVTLPLVSAQAHQGAPPL